MKYSHDLLADYRQMEYDSYMMLQQLHRHYQKSRQSIQDSGFCFENQFIQLEEIWTFNKIILNYFFKHYIKINELL